MSGELRLINRIRRRAKTSRASGVILGIGDDCAIFRQRNATEDLLFTTDMLIEEVHFQISTHRPSDAGYKALARGLSDIAAMGGEPRFCLVSLAAGSVSDRWIDGFYKGLHQLADTTGTVLAGGDLARADRTVCDIVVCGAAPRGKALRRDRAKPGHAIYVSGLLGGSALGLETRRGKAWQRHLRPEPRLRLGVFLRDRVGALAAMDLSDGLSIDLHRMCQASAVNARIEAPPRFPGATLEQSLHGGEDYELLFTVPKGTYVPESFEGVPLTRIGVIGGGLPGPVLLGDRWLQPLGYDHFRNS